MSRESIIDKVRKLRALSSCPSATLEEAATAARLAEKIIQEQFLAEAELEISIGSQEEACEDGVALTDWERKQTVWQNILLTHLTRAYNCQGVLKWTGDKIGFHCIGRPSDINTVRYQYSYFVLEFTRLAHLLAPKTLTRGGGKNWHNSFYRGAVAAIGEALTAVKQEVRANTNSSALSIFDKHAEEALALKKKLYPNHGVKNFYSNINRSAYDMGKQAGSNLNAKPGLSSGVRGMLSK